MKQHIVAVVPIRSFRQSKTRLAPALDVVEREAVMRAMAANVIQAVAMSQAIEAVLLVSPVDEVLTWGSEQPWPVIPVEQLDQSSGLDGAIDLGRDTAGKLGADALLSLFADLPFVTGDDVKAFIERPTEVILGPDRSHTGTNALFLRLNGRGGEFQFSFGPNSLSRHQGEAQRIGLTLSVRHVPGIAFDLDTPGDWDDVLRRPSADHSPVAGLLEAKVSTT